MKVQLISFRSHTKPKKRYELTIDIFNNSKSDLILFPGHTIENMYELRKVASQINNRRTVAFLELKNLGARNITNWLYKIEKSTLVNCFTHQYFTTSDEINNNESLADIFYQEIKKSRLHTVANKKACILICGELNILANIQSDKNRVKIRTENKKLEQSFKLLFADVDFFINPIHTPMGNQGKMHKRRVYLSKNGRAYFSTANMETNFTIVKNKLSATGSLQYCYYNGRRIEPAKEYFTKDYLSNEFVINS